METVNPRITIENTDAGFWLVRMEQQLSDVEHLDIRFKVQRKRGLQLRELQRSVLVEAQSLLDTMIRDLDKPDAG